MVAFYQQEQAMFKINDAIAVVRRLPWGTEVLRITKIKFIGETLIETFDNQFFSTADSKSLTGRQASYIEAATIRHLAAIKLHGVIR